MLERIEPSRARCRPPENGSRNVTRSIGRHETHGDNQWFRWSVITYFNDQLLRTHLFGSFPLSHGVRLRPLNADREIARHQNKNRGSQKSHREIRLSRSRTKAIRWLPALFP